MELSLILGISTLGLLFAAYLIRDVLRRDTGTATMREISDAIKSGAEAFLRRQYRTILYLSFALACIIYILYAFVRGANEHDPAGPAQLALWTTLSFVFGALCSVAAGYMGMWVAIRANIRTAAGALRDMNSALQPALRGGAVSGFFVVAMSLLGVAGLFMIVQASGVTADVTKIPLLIVGYGFGASFVALFAQLGGGIYTKAADVGADLVGKVEAGIPEDDPRNPAVIADLVGDNVGDCAGPRRGPVRIDGGGEHRSDDPRGRTLPGEPRGLRRRGDLPARRAPLPARGARVRHHRVDRRDPERQDQ